MPDAASGGRVGGTYHRTRTHAARRSGLIISPAEGLRLQDLARDHVRPGLDAVCEFLCFRDGQDLPARMSKRVGKPCGVASDDLLHSARASAWVARDATASSRHLPAGSNARSNSQPSSVAMAASDIEVSRASGVRARCAARSDPQRVCRVRGDVEEARPAPLGIVSGRFPWAILSGSGRPDGSGD
jgi:hypothetical protein